MAARILIVEDELSSRELMTGLLREAGHAVTGADDGASGLRLALDGRPDLILCAPALRDMDGRAIARRLKEDLVCARIPLVAVGAADAATGFDGTIGKPIEPASFVAEVEAFLPTAAQAQAPVPTLLVVDDDDFMREVLVDAIENEPWRILSAGSAAEALALLAREPVDVILSDQCMPGMQGTDLMARASRDYPRTVRLILSGLSGPSDLEAIERACAAGQVDRHLSKPWVAGSLREELRAAFALHRGRA